MQFAVRAFVVGGDPRVDVTCRTFCPMERTAYTPLRDSAKVGAVKAPCLKES
ncbi:MAG: hypothetical protein JRM96_01560 [Nitrososphaerota archaeon]|jgi:hypothetical protein|nr:hypothetical protein [Nitrososphaerota archaeon]MDG7004983.1 hypothetical protein [Nitrososphaerota archaeon]